ncbi:Zinc finger, CCHC-type,Reverse transcriptase domain [Cinara cedri]|uniref:Zinc finger, CCHC-type,Reverse transcriptase domain n=1 Tax=Cinara cedri TaxID=506608 RepID=A0A5E4MYI8_9HEMI|nr:Zinc finger, CCHC-type,Reverse transcriptase domain [Cinara cedri]
MFRHWFELLKSTEPADETIETIIKEKQSTVDPVLTYSKPHPPIFIRGVADFPGVCTKLIELIGVDNFICKNEQAEFHIFQLNEDKPMRIVIRNLHPSTLTELIKSELELRLYEVKQVTQVIHRIKEPRKPKIISQCQNCQAYGHTKAYCGYSPRCVRCGDDHSSSACPNSRQDPMRCALCTGNHPANYRGCTVYTNLQQRKKSNLNNQKLHVNSSYKPNHVQDSHPCNTTPYNPPPDQSQTYTRATQGQHVKSYIPPPTPDINSLMSSFVSELKTLINPLISLLTQSNHDIDEAVNNLTTLIQSAAWEATKPNKTHNSKNNYPIISDQIRCLIIEKRRTRAKYQVTRLPSHKSAYNKLANSLKKALAKYKSCEFEQKLHSLSITDGSLWRETKRLLKFKTASPPLLNTDSSLAVSDAEKAKVFRVHLSKTFYPHEDIHIPQHIIDVENYLHSTLRSARPEKYFTPYEVKSMISNCSQKKSPGFDLITANVANCLPNKAFILLTYIYNAVLRLSYFPTLWKFSQIIMFDKPDKPPDLPTSYRPISLLPYFSKICERLILKRFYTHIISKNILPFSQFGFRAKHSTVHQVHRVIDAISTSLENKCYCTCAFLDISQAFDKVWHEGLLFKLRSATSNIATISAGVPQGGVLSPILFNIYAVDQPSAQNTIAANYADDKVILSVHNDPLIASKNLQSHLNLLSEWYAKWKIKLNNNKSIHTTFTLRHGLCPNVTVNNLPIPALVTVKYLGLILDKRLTWQNHIRKKRLILNARSRSLKVLLSKNKFSSLKTKLQIYKSILKPIWTYGNQLWGSAKKSNLNKIQAFQNITLRKITMPHPSSLT